jgi:hypothetical protein
MSIDLRSSQILPATLAVVADFELNTGSAPGIHAWLVELKSGARSTLFLIEKESRITLSIVQRLPPHVGVDLEYNLRPPVATVPPPS